MKYVFFFLFLPFIVYGQNKSIESLSRELWEKEESFKVKEMKLKQREEQVLLNEKSLEKRIVAFQSKQAKVLNCLDKHDKGRDQRIKHMVDVLSGMRPAQAAEILSVQEEEISVSILALLSAEKIAKIFNFMDKEISARLQRQFMIMKK